MTGTFVNVIAILIGSVIGVMFGSRLSDHLKSTVLSGMGIFTAAVGMQMFLKTENSPVVLGALILGAVLGGFLSIAFASTMGIGVAFSALPVFAYQGGISLPAAQLNAIVNTAMMNELTATGGVLLIWNRHGSMVELKKIRVENFLPALAIAPVIVYILSVATK